MNSNLTGLVCALGYPFGMENESVGIMEDKEKGM